MMTVSRGEESFRVYKRTYLHEAQQQGAGIRLPGSRLEKIQATARQTTIEAQRTTAAAAKGSPASSDAPIEQPQPGLVRLGSNIAFALVNSQDRYEWWIGRVQQMFRKSTGARGRYVQVTEPQLYNDAWQSKMKVVCNWYKRQKQLPLSFLYGSKGGVSDPKQYSLEHAMALVELDFAADSELYTLRDSAQESQLNAALKLTMPSLKKGSKKTRGEEHLAREARVERENMPAPAPKRQRGPPTDRTATYAAQTAKK
uniref:Uncharacterized protein n=1 Tax=Coccolithus braarudii TaxID=221442 RepID=A0A6T7DN85_9EUKA|mmetsp:Transcript_20365/g.43697  ORF Transcript_20365/g.43697 Transcript_20365/m.43697 type:complete len:256 (+) Transcript_20365:804-1571(+)